MKFNYKKLILDAVCVVLFVIISYLYFYPAVIEGRRLGGHDHSANDGIKIEMQQYRDAHNNEVPRWINSVFGGMPTYQIAPEYDVDHTVNKAEKATHLWLPEYVWYVFAYMLGFYILLRAFNFRQWMAALGAVMWAFSSYFFIIIAAGHIWKVMCLAYIPPTIAGMVLCYKGIWKNYDDADADDAGSEKQQTASPKTNWTRILAGCAITAFYAALQIKANHVQMTYYFLSVELAMFVAFLIMAFRRKRMAEFGKGTAAVALAAVIAVAMNIGNLYHTYEYQKESIRGTKELVKANATNQTDSGLDRDYITAWSYGIDETFTFLIPNAKGGASVPLASNQTAMKHADFQFEQMHVYEAFPQYWGAQPGTSGPVYLGAIVCMLFVMSLFVISNKNPLKWALLFVTLLTLMLGWGHNFNTLTNWFIDNFPMYSKFRTVASILVVVEFTVPFLALWGLKEWVKKPNVMPVLYASVFTVVLCLGYSLVLSGDCVSPSDRQMLDGVDPATTSAILSNLSEMRSAMISSDVTRSVFIILLGAALMWWYSKEWKKQEGNNASSANDVDNNIWTSKSTLLSIALFTICVVDMWMVNKRYLNDAMFQPQEEMAGIRKTEVETYIEQKSGTGRDYRVLEPLTFDSNATAAFFSSLGGYHPAKLRRYNELIETYIRPEFYKIGDALQSAELDTLSMQSGGYPVFHFNEQKVDSIYPVLNMLNTRWFILNLGDRVPVENTAAFGNAWFATNIEWANNANEEIDALGKVNLRNTAVVAKQDFGFLKIGGDGSVKLTQYGSTEAKYEVDSKQGGLVVFSEVYYPGWTATIDGAATQVGRANYVLRAVNVPAGKHEVVFRFDPQTVHTTNTVAYCGLGALIVLIVGAVALPLVGKKKEE